MKAGRFRRRLVGGFVGVVVAVVVLGGPAATWLQDRSRQAAPDAAWDAVYLVAGARAQDRRLAAMEAWAEAGGRSPPAILIGNDPQKSYYSREHGRNLTRTEWAEVKLSASSILQAAPRIVVPGRFSGTDAEMAALGRFLADRPDIRRLALVTCRFHGRRTLRRFAAYAPDGVEGRLVPGTPHREDRQPWMVAAELLKLARDAVGLSRAPLLSRPAPPDA